jgi:cytochrome c5
MRSHPTGLASLLIFALLAGLAATASAAEEPPDSAAIKAHLKALDSGPKAIDVTKYPEDQKSAYKLFSKKCSKCHTIARPINSEFVLPAQWERYIKRMMYKPNSQMSDADGKRIYRFLVYDASVRKRELLKKALAGLSAEDRGQATDKIKAINPSFTTP